jgi:hypothetical protein
MVIKKVWPDTARTVTRPDIQIQDQYTRIVIYLQILRRRIIRYFVLYVLDALKAEFEEQDCHTFCPFDNRMLDCVIYLLEGLRKGGSNGV